MTYADYILNSGMHYFSFDFSGSGLSDGEYITLGVKETDDLETVVRYLRDKLLLSQIVLWGRSMGAVTALRYVRTDRRIQGLIADSPFSSLYKLALELGEEKTSIPALLLPPMLKIVEQTIKEKAGFEFKALDMLGFVQTTNVPGIFITSKEDSFVRSKHVEDLYEAYSGSKRILYVKGDHNNERTPEFLNGITKSILDLLTSKRIFRDNPKISLLESKVQQKFLFDQENTPALPLAKDQENKKVFNLQNILETNKEIAKKLVISKKKEPVARLDTEVLYDEFPEVFLQNHNKTSYTSAFRLKDKMQTFIHSSNTLSNSTTNDSIHGKPNIFGSSKLQLSHESIGSVKHMNDSKRVLNDFQPNIFTKHSPFKREHNYNYSFHSKNDETDPKVERIIKEFKPEIKFHDIRYSNPVDLKPDQLEMLLPPNYYSREGQKLKKEEGKENAHSMTQRNCHFV